MEDSPQGFWDDLTFPVLHEKEECNSLVLKEVRQSLFHEVVHIRKRVWGGRETPLGKALGEGMAMITDNPVPVYSDHKADEE